ncbi:MAG: metalloregulator ArsR/SmtB family transcription factor [Proteobacteria bacterium]|nr:metalloregulator ArsR/SmtB family transcription factor [Pseudomonadota bacterium]
MTQKKPRSARGVASAVLDAHSSEQLAGLFRALADPTRLRIVSAVFDDEQCVHDLASVLELEQSAVSHQLRMLRDLRIVRRRKEGRHVYYSLDDSHVRDLFAFALEHIRHQEGSR